MADMRPADPLISIKDDERTRTYMVVMLGAIPMTTLSNFHTSDSSKDGAWEQATLVLGVLTVLAVIVIMVFAST